MILILSVALPLTESRGSPEVSHIPEMSDELLPAKCHISGPKVLRPVEHYNVCL